jgi:hypothetical protein
VIRAVAATPGLGAAAEGGEMDAPCPPSLAWIEPRSAWVRRA